jgi:hypothetical protein
LIFSQPEEVVLRYGPLRIRAIKQIEKENPELKYLADDLSLKDKCGKNALGKGVDG